MKKLYAVGVGVLLGMTVLVGCGESEGADSTAGINPVPTQSENEIRQKCPDANLDENLTPAEYYQGQVDIVAEAMSRSGQNPSTLNRGSGPPENIAQLIRETPAGNQGRYGRSVCGEWIAKKIPMTSRPDQLTTLLAVGYGECLGLKEFADRANGAVPVDPEFERQMDVHRAKLQEMREAFRFIKVAAQKYLCPQYPLVEFEKPAGVDDCIDVALPGGSEKGTITVEAGDVSCPEAKKVIVDSWKQLVAEQAKGVYFKINGVTAYACNIAGAAESDSEGYDYKCESPTGDKVITWTADA